jgi:SpoIID/LytB domain protein
MALDGFTAEQIVTHYYSGTTVSSIPDLSDIAVNLLHQSPTVVIRSEGLAAGGGGVVVTVRGLAPVVGTAADVFSFTALNKVVTVTKTTAGVTSVIGTGSWATVNWSGTRQPLTSGTVPTLLNVTSSASQFDSSGHRYRYGSVKIQPATATPNLLEAINYVRIHDEYLLGIAEVSSSWPAAAMQAQIIASRSYALNHVNSLRAACLCNVDDGGGPYYDQTFAGWIKEADAWGKYWRAAVAATDTTATTGETILSNGQPIAAFYFSASGGATQSSADVWGGTLPYATSVDDHWSLDPSVPWSKWIPRVRSQAQVAAAFGLPDVVRIDLTSRCVSGAVKSATAWSSTGQSSTIAGARLAGRLGLPSRWIWRAVDTAAVDPVAATIAAARLSTSPTVVLAPAASPVSTALASNLASQRGWPLLLTSSGALTASTEAELNRRHPTTVFAVGTSAELPDGVLNAADAVSGSVVRISGSSAVDISVRVAARLGRPVGTPMVLAPATSPSLVAIASAAASALNRPLILVPGAAIVSSYASGYMTARQPASVLLVGGSTDIADSSAAGAPSITRAAGANLIDTSSAVARILGIGITTQQVTISSPARLTASLVMSPRSPLLAAASTLSQSTASVLQTGVASITVSSDLSSAVVTAARRA